MEWLSQFLGWFASFWIDNPILVNCFRQSIAGRFLETNQIDADPNSGTLCIFKGTPCPSCISRILCIRHRTITFDITNVCYAVLARIPPERKRKFAVGFRYTHYLQLYRTSGNVEIIESPMVLPIAQSLVDWLRQYCKAMRPGDPFAFALPSARALAAPPRVAAVSANTAQVLSSPGFLPVEGGSCGELQPQAPLANVLTFSPPLTLPDAVDEGKA